MYTLKIKNLMKSLVFFQIVYCLILGFLNNDLYFPGIFKYITDIITLILFLGSIYIYVKNKNEIRFPSTFYVGILIILLFFLIGSISSLIHETNILHYLWGIRNTFRFFAFFMSCYIILEFNDFKKICKIVLLFLPINVVLIIIQKFILQYGVDQINGTFGSLMGNNSAINAYFIIVTIIVFALYIKNKSDIFLLNFIFVSIILAILSAFNELKIYYVELILITIFGFVYIYTKAERKKYSIVIIILALLTMLSINIMYKQNPMFADFFHNPQSFINYVYTEPYWSSGGNSITVIDENGESREITKINRFSAFEIINDNVFETNIDSWVGLGIGNCDYSNYNFLISDNFIKYGDLNYTWFSSSFIFMETGYIGLILYLLFFLNFAIYAFYHRLKTKKQDYIQFICGTLGLLCIIFIFYGISLRSELTAYLVFALLSFAYKNNPEYKNTVSNSWINKDECIKKNTFLVTIIIPVFNVEKYVQYCLESVINQTYKNLEIIVVNDGSTDSSLSICQKYQQKDSRIYIINQENKGLSSARNTGLNMAHGNFVYFLDSDDYIDLNTIELLLKIQSQFHAEIVESNYINVSSHLIKKTSYENISDCSLIQKEGHDLLLSLLDYKVFTIKACGKLFDIKLFSDLRFKEGVLHEDEFLMPLLFEKAEVGVFLNIPCYKYYRRKGSIMTSAYSLKKLDSLKAHEFRIEHFKNLDTHELYILNYHYCNCIEKQLQLMDKNFLTEHKNIVNCLVKRKKDLFYKLIYAKELNILKKMKLFFNLKAPLRLRMMMKPDQIESSRILIVNFGKQFGGTEQYTLDIVSYFQKLDTPLDVICRANTMFHKKVSDIKANNLYAYETKNLYLPFKLLILIKKKRITTVHLNGIFDILLFLPSLVIFNNKVNFIYTSHGKIEVDQNNKYKVKLYTYILKNTACFIHNYIAVSNDMKNYLIKKGIDPQKITVIYNGIQVSQKIKKRKNVKHETINILTIGRLEKAKNQILLIQALNYLINEKKQNICCFLVGSGSEEERLKTECQRLGIDSHIVFYGYVNKPFDNDLINNIDLYVQPSLYESFGITVIEAMNRGIPTLVSNVGGMMEIIDNQCGYSFISNDYIDLANKILEVYYSDTSLVVKNAYAKVCKYFNKDILIKLLLNIYK